MLLFTSVEKRNLAITGGDVDCDGKVGDATVRSSGLLETEVAAPGQPW